MIDPQSAGALTAWFAGLREWDAGRGHGPSEPAETIGYGPHPDQHVDVWVPVGEADPPVLVSLHGGYFMAPYDKSLHTPVARDLTAAGFVVCNVEYRRGGAGRPERTTDDVWRAVDALAGRLRPRSLAVVGHSAGGYLAEWLAPHPAVDTVVLLAAVTDLAGAARAGWDGGAIAHWMGTGPDAAPAVYAASDLRRRPPSSARRVLLHGSADTAVGVSQSRDYAAALRAAGGDVRYVELPGEGHYGYLDPREPASAALRTELEEWRRGLASPTRGPAG